MKKKYYFSLLSNSISEKFQTLLYLRSSSSFNFYSLFQITYKYFKSLKILSPIKILRNQSDLFNVFNLFDLLLSLHLVIRSVLCLCNHPLSNHATNHSSTSQSAYFNPPLIFDSLILSSFTHHHFSPSKQHQFNEQRRTKFVTRKSMRTNSYFITSQLIGRINDCSDLSIKFLNFDIFLPK